ncbi:MAG TPA: serine/threonine-protein kinase, partial [Pyrinomonadaceae bacterium]|nr:serine/threonine-protein kinase [Pyrinomonadaceae bacterium]
MCGVCAGVGVAHRQGLLHRDLKPDNVIVAPASHDGERETAKVVDFGLAKVRDAANLSALTQTGTLLGTLYYMSPEQCRGEELDARAVVYSLGAMLYEMLTGSPPFVANNPTGLIAKHLSEAPPAFPQYLQPTALAQSCFRALAKNREERQADAISFGEELRAAMLAPDQSAMSTAKAAVPNSVIPHVGPSRRPLEWILAIVAGVVLAVGVLGIAIKVGLDRFASNDKADQNIENQSTTLPTPSQATGSESLIAPSSATSSDLRGTWTGTYGPLSQPATLVIKSHKGEVIEGVLEQGPVRVVFSGTAASGSVHLKQTRVLSGEGWSLGEDQGTISSDGKKMSGTGKDALGESLGMSYQ